MSTAAEMLENISVLFHSSIRIRTGNQVVYFDPYEISEETHVPFRNVKVRQWFHGNRRWNLDWNRK